MKFLSKKGLLPFNHEIPSSQDQGPKSPKERGYMRAIPYAFVEGSLMYVMLCTRSNICFAIGMVSRYHSNLGPKH